MQTISLQAGSFGQAKQQIQILDARMRAALTHTIQNDKNYPFPLQNSLK
jgi:hypothetical protein